MAKGTPPQLFPPANRWNQNPTSVSMPDKTMMAQTSSQFDGATESLPSEFQMHGICPQLEKYALHTHLAGGGAAMMHAFWRAPSNASL